jgi:recombination protein RecR
MPEALQNLIHHLHQLPGIGKKTAQRLAVYIVKDREHFAENLATALVRLKQEIRFCRKCFNITESDLCTICSNPRRDATTLCVIEDITDIMAIERTNAYNGLYHVLGGVISPLAGIDPDQLTIAALQHRLKTENIKEIIFALNPSTEGETTMIYLSNLLKSSGCTITRIASGIPLGAHLEFIDDATIGRALMQRNKILL